MNKLLFATHYDGQTLILTKNGERLRIGAEISSSLGNVLIIGCTGPESAGMTGQVLIEWTSNGRKVRSIKPVNYLGLRWDKCSVRLL
jgi:hypothetical protein